MTDAVTAPGFQSGGGASESGKEKMGGAKCCAGA